MEFKTLYRELVHSTEMIRALIKDIGQEQAQVRSGRGSWSIMECRVICIMTKPHHIRYAGDW